MKKFLSVFILLAMLLPIGCNQLKWSEHLKLSGTLELTEHQLGSRVPGKIASLRVDEGDEVKTGELLATLDRFDQAWRDYKRLVRLYQNGGASRQAVEEARLNLDDQRIVSPVNGVVLIKVHELGEVVAAGSAVMVVGDRSDIWVRVFVPEGKINRLKMGQPADVRFDGIKKTFKGRVSFIATKAEFTPRNVQTPEERVTQTFSIKVTLDQPEPYLRSGVAADVSINLAK